jgi:hypothetical protein
MKFLNVNKAFNVLMGLRGYIFFYFIRLLFLTLFSFLLIGPLKPIKPKNFI